MLISGRNSMIDKKSPDKDDPAHKTYLKELERLTRDIPDLGNSRRKSAVFTTKF